MPQLKDVRVSMTRFAHVVALTIVAPVVALAAGDPANLAPADSMIVVGWTELNAGDNHIVQLAQAILNSPLVTREADEHVEVSSKALDLIAAVSRHTGALWLMPAEKGAPQPVVGGIIVDAGKDAAAISEACTEMRKRIPDVKGIETATIDGVSLSHAVESGETTVHWGVYKNFFVAAIGETSVKRTIGLINGGKTLADQPELSLCRKKTSAGMKGWNVQLYVDLAGVIKQAKSEIEPTAGVDMQQASAALGLDAFKSIYVAFDETDAGARLSAFMHADGKAGGLMRLWAQNPLSDDDLAVVPADAYWAQVWNLELSGVWKDGLTTAQGIHPDAKAIVEGFIAAAAQVLGFNPADQLLPAFGESWALYDAPAHAGLLITGVVLVNEARDPAAIEAAIARGIELVTPFLQPEHITLQQREATIDGQHVKYVLVAGLPVPVTLSWGVTNKRIVFGLFPQTVAVALKQADPKSRGPSLLDNAEFKRTRPLLAKSLSSVSYCDSRYFERTFCGVMQLIDTAVASMSAGSKPSIDLAALPTFPKHMESVRNALGGTSHDADGVLYTGYGSTPLTFFVSGETSIYSAAMLTSILLPSLSRAREMSKRAVCAANLKGIGMGCALFADQNSNKFPDNFKALVDSGSATTHQFVCPSSDISDDDVSAAMAGNGGRMSYVYINGQTNQAGPSSVLAYELLENHQGEGGNVLFADMHVEFVKTPRFQAVIRDTYKRLNRENDIPAELRGEP